MYLFFQNIGNFVFKILSLKGAQNGVLQEFLTFPIPQLLKFISFITLIWRSEVWNNLFKIHLILGKISNY